METGLVKTSSLAAAPAALPRPRGTVRAVGLFSWVTSRQADFSAPSGSGKTSGGFNAQPAISLLVGGNASGNSGSHTSGDTVAAGHMAGGLAPSAPASRPAESAPIGRAAESTSTDRSAASAATGKLAATATDRSAASASARTPVRATRGLQASASFLDADRGSRHAEYLLVIYPGGELEEKLLDEQKQFSDDYAVTVRNKPHITVAAFQAGEVMEETLIRWIQRICTHYHSFDLTLNNYSGFPPHTIYLRVQDPQPFTHLMQQLRSIDEFIRSSGCPPVNLISRPFLSIAGGLTEQVYNRAMPDYSRRTFHDTFPVRELVLLKRTHAFDPCKTVNIFRLRAD